MIEDGLILKFPQCTTWRDVARLFKSLLPRERRTALAGYYHEGVFLFFHHGLRTIESSFGTYRIDTWNLIVHLMDLGFIENLGKDSIETRDYLMRIRL